MFKTKDVKVFLRRTLCCTINYRHGFFNIV